MKTTLRIAILGVSSVLALAACSGAKTQAVNTGTTAADMNVSELSLLKTGTCGTFGRCYPLPQQRHIPQREHGQYLGI